MRKRPATAPVSGRGHAKSSELSILLHEVSSKSQTHKGAIQPTQKVSLSSTSKEWVSKPSKIRNDIRAALSEFNESTDSRYDVAEEKSKERVRPTHGDECLMRDICTADLQAKLVALRNKKMQNQKRYRRELRDQRHANKTLQDRINELARQNDHFQEMIRMGRFGAELTEAQQDELLDREDTDDSPRSIASSVYDPGMSARGTDLLGVARQRSMSLIKMRRLSQATGEGNWSPTQIAAGTSIPETGVSNVPRARGSKRVSISHVEATLPFADDLLDPDSRPGSSRSRQSSSSEDDNTGTKKVSKRVSQDSLTSKPQKSILSSRWWTVQNNLQRFISTWMDSYGQLLSAWNFDNNIQDLFADAARSEFDRCESNIVQEISFLLGGNVPPRTFRDLVNSFDPRTRKYILDVVAGHFKVIGTMLRIMFSMQELSRKSLDPDKCCRLFVVDVCSIIDAKSVKLWMVDEKAELIWEWTDDGRTPEKRALLPESTNQQPHPRAAPAAPRSRRASQSVVYQTDRAVDLAANAARSGPSHDIGVTLNEDAPLCEPIKHEGTTFAVIQCFEKLSTGPDGSPQGFSPFDQVMLKLVAEQSGILFQRANALRETIRTVRRTLDVLALTSLYPCKGQDVYALAHEQLLRTRDLLAAQECVLYVAETSGHKGLKLWTERADGLGTQYEIDYGKGIAGWVAETEEGLRLRNAEEDRRFDFKVDTAHGAGKSPDQRKWFVKHLLAMPLKNKDGSLLGVCLMLNKEAGFSITDERLLRKHCRQVVLSLERRLPDTGHVEEKSRASETVPEALARCKVLLGCETALWFAKDVQGEKLILEAQNLAVPITDNLLGYTARTGVSVTLKDASEDQRFNPMLDDVLGTKTRSLLCVAVEAPEDSSLILGVLLCGNKRDDNHSEPVFDDQDRLLASVLAKQIGRLASWNKGSGQKLNAANLKASQARPQSVLQDPIDGGHPPSPHSDSGLDYRSPGGSDYPGRHDNSGFLNRIPSSGASELDD